MTSNPTAPKPNRFLTLYDITEDQLVHAVWELTLACNLKCHHCGSRAGAKRPAELTTEECLDLVCQLADMGTREVTLIGGEAYLRPDWVEIIRAITAAGMQCTMQTGAWHLDDRKVAACADAGLVACGVSLDGDAELHDSLRGRRGSFDAAISALSRLRAHGIKTSVNTQITAAVLPHLRYLLDELIAVGVRNWQVQLTVAMGRAADNHELLLQPHQMNELMPLLADLYCIGAQHGILLQPGNNIGYFGPFEALLRGSGTPEIHWASCFAGRNLLGIEADGNIKGCPSLPTATYTGGNTRTSRVADIWANSKELGFTRRSRASELWGFCGDCYYADVCEGGCTWTAHSLLGRRGNNPYCHYRASELRKQGLRERVVRTLPAPGTSFDHGMFDVVVERDPNCVQDAETIDSYRPPGRPDEPRTDGHVPSLLLCRGCNCYAYAGTEFCPHCGANIVDAMTSYEKTVADGQGAAELLTEMLNLRVR